jgi:Sec-independent protein translocase protein TatA
MFMLMLVALLLYGGELPKVARSWGKSLAEFKKGMSGIQNEFNDIFRDEPRRIPYHDPVYSHNAGTVDEPIEAHLAGDASVADDVSVADVVTEHDKEPEPFRETFRKETSPVEQSPAERSSAQQS